MPWSSAAPTRFLQAERPLPAACALPGRAPLDLLVVRAGQVSTLGGRASRRGIRPSFLHRRPYPISASRLPPVSRSGWPGYLRQRLIDRFQQAALAWSHRVSPDLDAASLLDDAAGLGPASQAEMTALASGDAGDLAQTGAVAKPSAADWVGRSLALTTAGPKAPVDLLQSLFPGSKVVLLSDAGAGFGVAGSREQTAPLASGDDGDQADRHDGSVAQAPGPDWVDSSFGRSTAGPRAPLDLLQRLAGRASTGATASRRSAPDAQPTQGAALLRSQAERTPSAAAWEVPFSAAAPAPAPLLPTGARQGFYPQAGSLPLPAAGQPDYRPPLAPPLAAATQPTLLAPQTVFDAPTPHASASLRQEAKRDEERVPEDLDELAAKIRQILGDQARRHGIAV